jgi:hypothetical protein
MMPPRPGSLFPATKYKLDYRRNGEGCLDVAVIAGKRFSIKPDIASNATTKRQGLRVEYERSRVAYLARVPRQKFVHPSAKITTPIRL